MQRPCPCPRHATVFLLLNLGLMLIPIFMLLFVPMLNPMFILNACLHAHAHANAHTYALCSYKCLS